ncbi:MAG: hypothetical protein CL681_11370 [Blastopirellula sp.]|nr:hypothetical protein [Blastopirellula sp.]
MRLGDSLFLLEGLLEGFSVASFQDGPLLTTSRRENPSGSRAGCHAVTPVQVSELLAEHDSMSGTLATGRRGTASILSAVLDSLFRWGVFFW